MSHKSFGLVRSADDKGRRHAAALASLTKGRERDRRQDRGPVDTSKDASEADRVAP